MGLFSINKKKNTGCKCTSENVETLENFDKDSKYIVLGACCKKSEETFENTKTALKEMGIDDIVVNLGRPDEIASFGVMQTPALVINKKVVSYGKLLKVEEVKKLIEAQL